MKLKTLALGAAAVGMLAPAATMAGNSNTMTVQAVVQAVCSFNSTTSLLDFGNIDPTTGGNKTASTSLAYTCTSGQAPTLTMPAGGTMVSGGNNLPFTLANTNTGSAINVTGTVTQAAYQAAAAGSYSTTVTYTIAP